MAYGFPEKTQITCPFCSNPINVLWIPEARKAIKSSWGGSKVTFRKVRSEEYSIQEDCKFCKRSKEEIQKKINEEQRERTISFSGAFEKHSFRKRTT